MSYIFYQNLEFFHEDVRKSDVEYEHGPRTESGKVPTGALPPSAHPEWECGTENSASRMSEYKGDSLLKEHALPDRSVLRDHKNFAQKTVSKVSSGVNSLEDEMNEGPKTSGLQRPALDPENQKLNCGKTKERSQQGQEHTDWGLLPVPQRASELSTAEVNAQEPEVLKTDFGQVVLRPKVGRTAPVVPAEDGDSSLSSPMEETMAPDNIAFMITKTAVQVLSSGEVRDIVSRKGEDVQTVNIDAKRATTSHQEGAESEEPVVCLDKKPVIIIFDEPMDIRSAYKRLSTIFEECDEELERMMTEEKIEEEEEEENGDAAVLQNSTSPRAGRAVAMGPFSSGQQVSPTGSLSIETKGQARTQTQDSKFTTAGSPGPESKDEATENSLESPKKKFKFKFPKKQLAALTQAIRTGTKTGKKTLQVVVYEEEEEDGTLKQHKEAKRFEITRSQPEDSPKSMLRRFEAPGPESMSPISRTDEIRKNTYRTLDSLEQTIKQLETTISEMSPKGLVESSGPASRDPGSSASHITGESAPRSMLTPDAPSAPSSPSSIPPASRKGTAAATPQTSRMPVPMSSKNRPGSLDKAGSKQSKLQDPRQYRQANGSAKKAGGDCKPTFPSLPASKIPALSPSSGKSSSLPSSSGDNSNFPNPSATKPSVTSNPLSPQTGRSAPSASLIPSVSNGSLKFQSPTHTGKGHHLSFSLQTQNGRAALPSASSSSPPSPASPTSLNQGAKSIRTIHTPSLTSYKAQNGSSSKTAPSTAKETA